jgi:hypothetical protein
MMIVKNRSFINLKNALGARVSACGDLWQDHVCEAGSPAALVRGGSPRYAQHSLRKPHRTNKKDF